MTDHRLFLPGTKVSQALLHWHKNLDKNRGQRAALTRAASLGAVALTPAFIVFLEAIKPHWPGGESALTAKVRERLAAIAGLAAHVREEVRQATAETARPSIARQMAGFEKNELPVSPTRFRRLLERENVADLYGGLIRAIRLLDRKVDLLDLARSIYAWGPEIRNQWAYAYYPTALEKKKKQQPGDSDS